MSDLFQAAREGQQDVFEAYAAENPTVKWDGLQDQGGNTVLILAASTGKLHLVQWLHAQGARLDAANNNGKIAVQIAFEGGHPNTTRGILELHKQSGVAHPLSDADLEKLKK